MENLLAGKVAVVTGSASGIGRASVELFAEHGARVVVADVNEEQGLAVAEALGNEVAAFRKVDVSDPEQVQALMDFTIDRFGALDIMYNNAGISGAIHSSFLDDDLADFQKVISVNLYGTMVGCQIAARHMVKHGGGSIINTSSLAALTPGLPLLTYRAAKAGVMQLTQCIARELGVHGVRVNCIAPGHIPAGMTFYDISARIKKMQPLQRQGSALDVANTALYLASDLSAQVTGVIVPVDGGTNLGAPIYVKERA
ncbi:MULTISPECIES: SDR family NAD(P)-dependent oxidoreductase [unclassified Ketobacter]|uniref:SDR family NAD(P)-dependent oxidoreductase n=1 Tax=unclassified Ketobacter TaxID=2639109 RepID=UPI000F289B63|nr:MULTISPECIES: SDR family NAD(P)-dependent oxidoreductase [unclassified Ketobacter]RLT90184.1 MAG: SDR family oxidoreductase [Ketobacter sp. GenoA1]RLT93619.1 MAG: SDR family oxidoreductase [Ketobacter sp.]